eukprot:CAMPEP_0197465970 /NCGR_PEP_ID=MMETSP1175-20131217/64811_1 /TAXON_ID=1003142 /ORGANISM="Triceratium dubium, Strain CCMP147" /LENGTH=1021 /DNA_ID=CAMNT_0043001997 /DNA_START=37 /DNA_END=3102 /DNA_ORIENTATION=+
MKGKENRSDDDSDDDSGGSKEPRQSLSSPSVLRRRRTTFHQRLPGATEGKRPNEDSKKSARPETVSSLPPDHNARVSGTNARLSPTRHKGGLVAAGSAYVSKESGKREDVPETLPPTLPTLPSGRGEDRKIAAGARRSTATAINIDAAIEAVIPSHGKDLTAEVQTDTVVVEVIGSERDGVIDDVGGDYSDRADIEDESGDSSDSADLRTSGPMDTAEVMRPLSARVIRGSGVTHRIPAESSNATASRPVAPLVEGNMVVPVPPAREDGGTSGKTLRQRQEVKIPETVSSLPPHHAAWVSGTNAKLSPTRRKGGGVAAGSAYASKESGKREDVPETLPPTLPPTMPTHSTVRDEDRKIAGGARRSTATAINIDAAIEAVIPSHGKDLTAEVQTDTVVVEVIGSERDGVIDDVGGDYSDRADIEDESGDSSDSADLRTSGPMDTAEVMRPLSARVIRGSGVTHRIPAESSNATASRPVAPLVEGNMVVPVPPAREDGGTSGKTLRQRQEVKIALLLATVLVVVAVAVGIGVGISLRRPSAEDGDASVSARFGAMELIVGRVSSQESLANTISPQYQALVWLADNDTRQVSVEDTEAIVQRYALAVLYFSTEGEGWVNNTNYLTGRHECEWHGVGCESEAGAVKSIDIDYNNLTGTVPREIFALRLDDVSLNANSISGTIPDDICNMSSAVNISLYRNSLTGTIPSCIGELSNVRDLELWDNLLTGTIPESVDSMKVLSDLDLSINMLTGTISTDFFEHHAEHLIGFILYDNMLSGSMPSSVNHFNGTDLLLGGNSNMSGTIPDDIAGGASSNLQVLGLWKMGLTGTLPANIFRMRHLAALALSENDLTGPIPQNIGETPLPDLRGMSLERNRLSGSIPASTGNLVFLEAINMHSNHLNGSLPVTMGNMTSLKLLELSNNELSGSVPTSFRNLTDLFFLSVKRNNLQGSMNFLCDISISLLSADCKDNDGGLAEVECVCCYQCCRDDEGAGCNWYIDSVELIKLCAGADKGEDKGAICGDFSF